MDQKLRIIQRLYQAGEVSAETYIGYLERIVGREEPDMGRINIPDVLLNQTWFCQPCLRVGEVVILELEVDFCCGNGTPVCDCGEDLVYAGTFLQDPPH